MNIDCPVCFEPFSAQNPARHPRVIVPCVHTCCTECIGKWVEQKKSTCPCCGAQGSFQTVEDVKVNFVMMEPLAKMAREKPHCLDHPGHALELICPDHPREGPRLICDHCRAYGRHKQCQNVDTCVDAVRRQKGRVQELSKAVEEVEQRCAVVKSHQGVYPQLHKKVAHARKQLDTEFKQISRAVSARKKALRGALGEITGDLKSRQEEEQKSVDRVSGLLKDVRVLLNRSLEDGRSGVVEEAGRLIEEARAVPMAVHRLRVETDFDLLALEAATISGSVQLKSLEPFLTCCENGFLTDVKQWKEVEGVDVNACDAQGFTGLHLACRYGRWEVVRYLVGEAGASMNRQTKTGRTPLHEACFNGHLDVAEYLMETGKCDVTVKNQQGRSPLYLAFCNLEKLSLPLARYILQRHPDCLSETGHDDSTPVYYAAYWGLLAHLKFMVEEAKIDIRSHSCRGDSIATAASKRGHTSIVEYLLAKENLLANDKKRALDGPVELTEANKKAKVQQPALPLSPISEANKNPVL